MQNPDLFDVKIRKLIIDEIKQGENLSRKRAEQRKFDVYRNRQDRYVIEKLKEEFSDKTVRSMRKVLSINPAKRIVEEMASLYRHAPTRLFSNASESEQLQLDNLYHYGQVNSQMRLANIYYKLHDQAALYLVPKYGKICARALAPHMYDVIPDVNDPERAFAYVLSVWDLDTHATYGHPTSGYSKNYSLNDKRNQTIADDSDRKQVGNFVFWTDQFQITCDEHGNLTGEPVEHELGVLPFVDLALEKDFQFFVRRGSSLTEFVIELLAQLSDLATISRLQGYSQAVVYSREEPKDIVIGVNKVLWIKQEESGQGSDPKFEFATPSPDLNGSLEILNTQLKMFLSSLGLDPATVSGRDQQRAFTSGIDHLLTNLDKFQASQQDMELFRFGEHDQFEIIKSWSNFMQQFTGDNALIDPLRNGLISDKVDIMIKYHEPTNVRTQSELEDSVIKLLDNGLMTKNMAIQKLYGADEEKAQQILEEIEQGQMELKAKADRLLNEMRENNEATEDNQEPDQSNDQP
jgi:hypothetical protein